MTKKEIAEAFLKLASSGKVREAFAWYVHSQFRHHNAYFKGDRESLLRRMEENAKKFPDKTLHTLRAVEEGDLVAIHARVVYSPEEQWSVIHIFRFKGNLIIEEWEASQEASQDSPNENGIF
jgi:predicted SnoaL-like aldol condensation-catalyzing enzyme